jgi:hypothetical protein
MTIAINDFFISSPGPRPPFYLVAQHLWGADCNFDSDGNSQTPEDTGWTELTVALRDATGHEVQGKRVDVEPSSHEPLVLRVSSADLALALAVAKFIVGYSGGAISSVT